MAPISLRHSPETIRAKFKSIPIFKDLSEEDIKAVSNVFYDTHFEKETVIFYERDLPSDSGAKIYFVLSGCVKLVKYSSDGESTIVRLASIGEFFGVTGVLTNKPSPYSAEALSDVHVLYIDKENFLKLIHQYPQIAVNIITALGEVLWFNYETHNQVVKKTDSRVSKIILYHLKRDGYTETPEGKLLNIQLPHDYIASMTGIAYEESVRIISRLKKTHGCINYLRGGKIVVIDMDKLAELAHDDELWGC